MAATHGDTQTSSMTGDSGVADGGHKKPFVTQLRGELESFIGIANYPRNDSRRVVTRRIRCSSESIDVFP